MITINELIFNYRKENSLFRQFSLQMEAGRIVGLLGKNGAGKSTLLSLIAGLLMPQKGEITVNGYKPSDRNPHFLSDILYQEKCPQGYRIICPSDGEHETLIDMELFFNALFIKP